MNSTDIKEKGWFEERVGGVNEIFGGFLYRRVPRGVNWWYCLGSSSLFVFIILVVTGIFLMMNYSPSPDHAYYSIAYIMNNVPFGAVIRSIHHWAATFMIILIGLHLIRIFYMGAYKYPRELNWIIGVCLLLLVVLGAFTGYLLPWDQTSYWATSVGSNLVAEVPWIGGWLKQIVLGGNEVGTVTLTRFYTLHIALIPTMIIALIGVHIFMVVKQGISSLPGTIIDPIRSSNGKEKGEVNNG